MITTSPICSPRLFFIWCDHTASINDHTICKRDHPAYLSQISDLLKSLRLNDHSACQSDHAACQSDHPPVRMINLPDHRACVLRHRFPEQRAAVLFASCPRRRRLWLHLTTPDRRGKWSEALRLRRADNDERVTLPDSCSPEIRTAPSPATPPG